jgi:hypothetical protein
MDSKDNATLEKIFNQISLIGNNTIIQFNEIQHSLNNIENNLTRQSNNHFEILQKQISENYTKLQIESLKMHNVLIKEIVYHFNEIKKEVKKSEDNIKQLLQNHERENLKTKLLIAENKLN